MSRRVLPVDASARLSPDSDGAGNRTSGFSVENARRSAPTRYGRLVLVRATHGRRRLFLETLDDLETRIRQEASEYDLLRAAALLRELLLDDSPLVHQVNRTTKIPLRFHLRVKMPEPGNRFEIWLGLDPNAEVDVPIHEVGVKELLGTSLVFLPTASLTTGQIVTLAANVRGGVHRGKPKDPAHEAFETFRLKLRHGDMPLELLLVVEISKVVPAGLEPLRSAVRNRSPAPTPRIPRAARVTVETVN